MVADPNIKRNGAAGEYRAHGRRIAFAWDNVRVASVMPSDGLKMGNGCAMVGDAVRPQGGWGVDHPTKVQQRKAQTESLSAPPRGISYPFQVPAGTIFSVYVDSLFVL